MVGGAGGRRRRAGLLAGELGTHALVLRSADRGRAARKRWYAGVSVHPLAEGDGKGAERRPARPGDHRHHRAGAGRAAREQDGDGRARAPRPSGITVRVCDERSQRANVRRAVERLAARLAAGADERRAEGEARAALAHHRLERGAPVRTYRLGARGALEG